MSDEQATNGDGPDAFGRVFTLKDDLRQRDVATWNRIYSQRGAAGVRTPLAVERQAALEGAIGAGWIVSPPTAAEVVVDMKTGAESQRYTFDGVPVDELRPAEVNYYGGLCSRLYDRLMAIPKGSSST